MRYIGEAEIEDIALGAGILGTGGGGDPRLGALIALQAVREHGPVALVGLDEVADDDFVVPISMMGAPAVASEKLPSMHPVGPLVETLVRTLGRPATHTMAAEIGGIAALLPIAAAAVLDVPLIDADMMGRAFPELQMVIPSIQGIAASPMTMGDEWGNVAVLNAIDNPHCERLARTLCVEMGASALMALYTMSGAEARPAVVTGTVSLAKQIGSAVRTARRQRTDPVAAAAQLLGGGTIFSGKVVDLDRRTASGFTRLQATIEGLDGYLGDRLRVSSQNEHLVAWRIAPDAAERVVATTPDLLIVLDTDSGEAVTTEALRFGARVSVLAAPCDPRYTTPRGLAVVGPRAFGYDLDEVLGGWA